ncbi:MAG: transcriptional repressor LexA [Armatimonadetes bacterium]|nr:transcriptional repressor LexA [Armatimonadota bacterium]
MQPLSPRQREVLEYVSKTIGEQGIVPTVREVARALGVRSPATVQQHIDSLAKKGYLRRLPDRMRALEILDPAYAPTMSDDAVALPVVGKVSAGPGGVAEELIEEFLPVPRHLGWNEGCFILRVRGSSMIDAGIFDGDMAIVRHQGTAQPGDIIVALLGEEATVKRLCVEDGAPYLKAENAAFAPIHDVFSITGKVVGLLRRYETRDLAQGRVS